VYALATEARLQTRAGAGTKRGSGHVGRRRHGREGEAWADEAGAGHCDTWRIRAPSSAAGDGVHLGWEGEADPGDTVRASRRLRTESSQEEALRPVGRGASFRGSVGVTVGTWTRSESR